MGVPSTGSPTVTSEACFLDPHPWKKKVRSPKIWRIIFYSTYGRLKGLVPVGQLCCETPCHWILPDPISILIGCSGTPTLQASMVLLHPVPAFVTVLSVLFSLDNFSVAPTEESQLSWEEQKRKCLGLSGCRGRGSVSEAEVINSDRDQIRTGTWHILKGYAEIETVHLFITKTAGHNKPPGLGKGNRAMRTNVYQLSTVSANKRWVSWFFVFSSGWFFTLTHIESIWSILLGSESCAVALPHSRDCSF